MYALAAKMVSKCVTACGDCRGQNCRNSEDIILASDEQNFGLEG